MHNHNECAHEKIKHCARCDVAYCPNCGKEWHTHTWYYYGANWSYPPTYTLSTNCTSRDMIQSEQAGEIRHCDHETDK